MQRVVYPRYEKVKGFTWLLVFSFALWLALSPRLDWPELITGGVVCLIVCLFTAHIYSKLDLPPLSIKRISFFLVYVIVLFWDP